MGDYWGAGRALHLWSEDELALALEGLRYTLDSLHSAAWPDEAPEMRDYIAEIIRALSVSTKQSLIDFYPDRKKDILELSSFCATAKKHHLALYKSGLTLPMKAFDVLASLSALHRDMKQAHFEKLRVSILEYCHASITRYRETESRMLRGILGEVEPLVHKGHLKNKQVGAPREKRNPYILKYCLELKEKAKRKHASAAELLMSFPNENEAAIVNGAKVYREYRDGKLTAICILPDGQTRTVSLRNFQKYFDEKSRKTKKSDT